MVPMLPHSFDQIMAKENTQAVTHIVGKQQNRQAVRLSLASQQISGQKQNIQVVGMCFHRTQLMVRRKTDRLCLSITKDEVK